jgi:hypothetical protein
MDKKIVGLVGAISGLMSLSTAQATAVPPAETALPSAQSFGELLDPIPNAAALLRIADAAGRHNPNVKLVGDNHHHHHQHHHHHHHHHHHNYHHHHHHNYHDHDSGHGRHYYQGRWWDYGVGPCWQRTPVGWIWICGD